MWWARELAHAFEGPARGYTDGRPAQVSYWTSRARRGKPKPEIVEAKAFADKWWAWYGKMNPEWRVETTAGPGHFERGRSDGGWDVLAYTGPNGMLNVLICLRWWRDAIDTVEDQAAWNDAVEDVAWVLEEME
ncbi:hypothetical protein B0H15DRAFT_783613 [Mycena belliarum]|uniref:Uncharacterized protein n=1 Tax=Mycena belliarum TaxID=1033014 RepID=A0AAD6XP79_9AGAR|nr:hypothetical protein B0H15DRAFT_783613 [Mycena belliae]